MFKPCAEHGRERVLVLGGDANLIGIATEAVTPSTAKPSVIMLNAGVLHRVGPRRLHVILARALATRGFSTCRLDLSGIGDSRAVANHGSFRESAVADTRMTMDQLTYETGVQRFVLFGLCSGADNALATAAVDPRVVGLVLIDPPTYATLRAHARKYLRRAARSGLLAGVIAAAAAVARPIVRRLRRRPQSDASSGGRQPPPKADYRKLLNDLSGRGANILSIYSGAMRERYNHREQLFELFPELRGRTEVEYFGEADHVFTEVSAQARLMETVIGWLARTYV
jgi:pimeloyl-ACP methyl ester carboxylesterase